MPHADEELCALGKAVGQPEGIGFAVECGQKHNRAMAQESRNHAVHVRYCTQRDETIRQGRGRGFHGRQAWAPKAVLLARWRITTRYPICGRKRPYLAKIFIIIVTRLP